MNPRERSRCLGWARALVAVWVWVWAAGPVRAADVVGYSVLKGQFLNQVGPDTVRQDPDFGYSLLASVDLADFDLLDSAELRLPDGGVVDLDDQGDYWAVLDTFETDTEMNDAYAWGDYVVRFDESAGGAYTCLVELPESDLPPVARLVNFEVSQAVDASRPLTLAWDFEGAPAGTDFVQLYVNLGHGEVFSTPNIGEEGALTSADRQVTIPADTLIGGEVHELNLEITRIVSTDAGCHPSAEGVGAVFRSTSVLLYVYTPATIAGIRRLAGGGAQVEVLADPYQPVVLQGSDDFRIWTDVAEGASDSGTNLFEVVTAAESPGRFFRAVTR